MCMFHSELCSLRINSRLAEQINVDILVKSILFLLLIGLLVSAYTLS